MHSKIRACALGLALLLGIQMVSVDHAHAQFTRWPGAQEWANGYMALAMPLHFWMVSAQVTDAYSARPGFDTVWAVLELGGGVCLATGHVWALDLNINAADQPGAIGQLIGLGFSLWYIGHAIWSLIRGPETPTLRAPLPVHVSATSDGAMLQWRGTWDL